MHVVQDIKDKLSLATPPAHEMKNWGELLYQMYCMPGFVYCYDYHYYYHYYYYY